MKRMKEKENGGKASVGAKASGSELFAYLREVLPDYNRESVYASDVKKIITWYNILVENQIDLEEERTEDAVPESPSTDEEHKEIADDGE
jgi:hypothetical protein